MFEDNEALLDKYATMREAKKELTLELQTAQGKGGARKGPETAHMRCQTDLGMEYFDRDGRHGDSSTALGTNQPHGASANDLDIGGLLHDQSI